MNIILTENVKGLGEIGDIVRVKPGYARNFLIPKGIAVEASSRNVKELEHHQRQLARKAEKLGQEAADLKARIEAVECTFAHKASEEGKLFGSVTSMEIAEALAGKGIEIDRRKIQLDQPIKSLGEHEVDIKLNAGANATLKIQVVDADQQEQAEAAAAAAAEKSASEASAEEA